MPLDLTVIISTVVAGGGVVATAVLGLTGPLLGRVAKLEERMGNIEVENRELLSLFGIAVTFIHRIGVWVEGTNDERERPEVPDQLRPHIDAAPWGRQD